MPILRIGTFWVGKNTFPFEKSNELFWSDNVFPEGIAVSKGFRLNVLKVDSLNIKAGHFVLSTAGQLLQKDAYFQGFQTYFSFLDQRLEAFPSFYRFKNIPNIPDGFGTFNLDYSIFHVGSRLNIWPKHHLAFEFDYYKNLYEHELHDSVVPIFKSEDSGVTLSLNYGYLENKNDWQVKATYTLLERYAIVDFMAQNDWARWSYSSFGSPDGRLSNFQGVELVLGYKVAKKVVLKMKYYLVEQLLSEQSALENGQRIRFDIDVKF